MWRRSFIVLAASSLLTAGAGAAVPVKDQFEGKLVAVTGKALTVLVRNGDNVSIMIADDCRITLDGQPVQRDRLGVGLFVAVSAVDEGTVHVAKTIVARSQE